ncbi:MAG: hypothetical protein Kow00123_27110 [Anaerolineales bacterium]
MRSPFPAVDSRLRPGYTSSESNREAAMPDRPKTLWIKDAYLAQILAGQKTVEVRVGYPNILRLRPGSPLRLNDIHPARVRRIAVYPDFAALVQAEDVARIAPGMSPDELLAALRALYPPDKEALGAVALEIELERGEVS